MSRMQRKPIHMPSVAALAASGISLAVAADRPSFKPGSTFNSVLEALDSEACTITIDRWWAAPKRTRS